MSPSAERLVPPKSRRLRFRLVMTISPAIARHSLHRRRTNFDNDLRTAWDIGCEKNGAFEGACLARKDGQRQLVDFLGFFGSRHSYLELSVASAQARDAEGHWSAHAQRNFGRLPGLHFAEFSDE